MYRNFHFLYLPKYNKIIIFYPSIIDLFVDSGVVAERAKNSYQEAIAIADATANVVSNLNKVISDPNTTGEERLQAINENMEGLRNVAPGTAAEIEKLQAAIKAGDPEALARTDELLTQIADSTAFEAIDALNDALKVYQGTLIFVSHDRKFVSSLATRIIDIKDNKLIDFQGTYEEYLANQFRM